MMDNILDNLNAGDGNGRNRGTACGDASAISESDVHADAAAGDGDSKPPARPADNMILDNPVCHNVNQFSHAKPANFLMMNGSSKIEAPTSQNIEPYLKSLKERTDINNNNNLPADEMDRKLPPSTANDNIQPASIRGRQRYRNYVDDFPSVEGFVPLRFVHVPNNADAALERAPSVPNLISYLHHHQQPTLLSDETLRDKERLSRKEQFEERLRRAHLRLNSDAETSVTRYRSKSTPSRGGMWGMNESQRSESGNAVSMKRQAHYGHNNNQIGASAMGENNTPNWHANGTDICENGSSMGETHLIPENLRHFETASSSRANHANDDVFHQALSLVLPRDSGFGSSPPAAALVVSKRTPGEQTISCSRELNHDDYSVGTAHAAGTSSNDLLAGNSSVSSSDGSRRPRTLSGISLEGEHRAAHLEPPPPPPPATEKERLVERERQARLETERARRRHLALLRERRLEDDADSTGGVDVDENEGSDNVDLIGQVSFDVGLMQPAPQFVGSEDNALVLAELLSPGGHSSVGSSMASIPRPPLPPPPATERERLVERERQARLETERARRRHLALQRERHLDHEEDSVDRDVDLHSIERRLYLSNGTLPATSLDGVIDASLPKSSEREDDNADGNPPLSTTSIGYRNCAQSEVQNADAEANSLSYPMERFLERVDDDGPNVLPIDASAAENDAVISYTMELFLAENAVVGTNDRGGPVSGTNESTVESIGGRSDDQIHRENNDGIELPVTPPAVQPSLVSDAIMNEMPPAPLEWSTGINDLPSSSGSVDSIISSTNQRSLDDHEIVQNTLSPIINSAVGSNLQGENSWVLNADSSPSRISISPSHVSYISNSRANPNPSGLTEADIAQLAEVEHASTGNAAPQSVRDEPSVSSVVGRGVPLHHAFSVATQTTVIESVTEASVGRGGAAFGNITEGEESFNVIRVGTDGSIQASSDNSGGASSASIEAMPSSDSGDGSGDVDQPSSEGINDSFSHTDEISQLPLLTEADIVTMADIDNASTGNAPPASVRDERLSESSVIERSRNQFGIATPITAIGSIDEQINLLLGDGSDPSDQSDNSIEAMPSEHGDHERMNSSAEEMIVYHASDMGSSASIEALPSIDPENEIGLHNYGAIGVENSADELTMHIANCAGDIETAPLISARNEQRERPPPGPNNSCSSCADELREKPTPNERVASSIFMAMAEVPTFIVIAQGSEPLCSLLGMKRYRVVLASLVVVTSILNHSGKGEELVTSRQMSFACHELRTVSFVGISLGFLIGSIGFIISDLDIWFAIIISFATAAATIISRLCYVVVLCVFQTLNHGQGRRILWTGPLAMGCQDFIRCLVILQGTFALRSARSVDIDDDDVC